MTSDGPSQIIEFAELDFIRLVGNVGTRLEGSFEPLRGRGFHALVEACNAIDQAAGMSPFDLPPVARGVATLLRYAKTSGPCTYEAVAGAFGGLEADRLWAEACDSNRNSGDPDYYLPVSPFGVRPSSYSVVKVADIPPPLNLFRDCHLGEQYTLLMVAETRRQRSWWRRWLPVDTNQNFPLEVRKPAFKEFTPLTRTGRQARLARRIAT